MHADYSSRLLSLAAGVVLDIDPVEAVQVASDSGYPAVGIWFDANAWTDQRATAVRHALQLTGLIALDIEPIMLLPDSDHGDRIVDAAVAIDARHVLVASVDDDRSRVASRLHTLATRLQGTDITLVLEFLPILGINDLTAALDVVQQVGHPAVGLLIDNLHLARAGHSPAELRGIDSSLMPYLQLCDASKVPADTSKAGLRQEALHGRLLPGEGALPLTELLDAIPDVPISLELRSEYLMTAYPDPRERARVLFDATTRFLRRPSKPYSS